MKRYIWLFLVIISLCWIANGLAQFGNDPFQKSDTTTTVVTQYDLTTGLALKLDKTAVRDSILAIIPDSVVYASELTAGLLPKLDKTAVRDSVLAALPDSIVYSAELTAGLAGKLDKAAFDDSIRSTFRKVVYVRPGESIQAAFTSLTGLSATQYGAVVLLPGTHTITSTVEMRRWSALIGYGNHTSVLYSSLNNHNMITADSSCIVIKDLTIRNSSTNAQHGITINCSSDFGTEILPFKIYNVRIEYTGSLASNRCMIYVNGSSTYKNYLDRGSIIDGCELICKASSSHTAGIYIRYTSGSLYNTIDYPLLIKNNYIYNTANCIQFVEVENQYITLSTNTSVTELASSYGISATGTNDDIPSIYHIQGGRYSGTSFGIYIAGSAELPALTYLSNISSNSISSSNATITYSDVLDGENIIDDTIDDDALDFGSGTDQIDTDDLPAGSTNKYQDAELTNWIDDVTLGADGSITIPTTKHITVGTDQWDNGSNKIDGEKIADDTIDDDSIDLTDITLADFTDDVGYFKADGTIPLTGDLNFTGAAPEITSANSLKIPAFEVIDSDTLNIGTGTDVIRIVKSGHHLSFITSDGNVYYTSVKNDSTQF